jgi:hypothetical protein
MHRITKVAAIAATALTALIATSGAASAATYDDARVGTVAKDDVMKPLGLNEFAFQGIVKTNPDAFTFTDVFTATTDTTWGCSDGSVQHHYRNTILTSPINAQKIYNASANKVTGWTLTGKGQSVITENNTGGTRFPNFTCPAGTSADFSKYNVAQSHSQAVSFVYNGTSYGLPNTVVEVAPAA